MSYFLRYAVTLLAMAMLCAGCASVQMASTKEDANAKTFAVDAEKANIYIYRHGAHGGASTVPVIIDGRKIGETAVKTFMRIAVPPGEHTLVSRGEKSDAVLSIRAVAGKNYFVSQLIDAGMLSPGSALKMVDDDVGRRAVQECALIEQWL
ncbi:DUF2846 domain-containing protein [Noviherbaspirillum saxi]|nr:DUF2846 domain-containing protein [Noviherbaspirillum saxi]